MPLPSPKPAPNIEAFLARWGEGEGGQERANYALFLSELCDVLDVPRPDQASHDAATNAYAFERAVTFREPDGSTAGGSTFTSAALSFWRPSKAGGRAARRRYLNKAICSWRKSRRPRRAESATPRAHGTRS
jgi:hypothetical protein